MMIPFNRPYQTHKELWYISQAIHQGRLCGDGPFTERCQQWLEHHIGCGRALMTHSCTAALEMAAILVGIRPGDEVIMPSYTFVSTANAFVLRGGVPVFVDIRPDTLNMDENLIEAAITEKTRAIVPVHYAGVACEMDRIMEIADRRGLWVIEDAAQGIMCGYHGRPLGSIGHLGTLSFHETKNIVSGEGGALLVNAEHFIERAEIIRQKGTNRSKFLRGQVDKYTWVDVGSSFLPGELISCFLYAQLEEADQITSRRLEIWEAFHARLAEVEAAGRLQRPKVMDGCVHNAHIYYILVSDSTTRDNLITHLKKKGVNAAFHFVPLHNSVAGRTHGRTCGELAVTEDVSDRLVRLPLWVGLGDDEIDFVCEQIKVFFRGTLTKASPAPRRRAWSPQSSELLKGKLAKRVRARQG